MNLFDQIKNFIRRDMHSLKTLMSAILTELKKEDKAVLTELQKLTEETKKKSEYTHEIEVEIDPEEIRGPAGASVKGDKGDPGQSIKGDKGDRGKDADETAIRKSLKAWVTSLFHVVQSKLLKDQVSFQKSVKAEIPKWSTIKKEIRSEVKKNKPVVKNTQTIIKQTSKAFDLLQALLDITIIKAIARGLEKLKGKDRLSAKAIRGLTYGGSATVESNVTSVGTAVAVANISSQFDGATTSFSLPAYSQILQFTITGWPPNGILLPTTDFTTPDNTHVALVIAQVTAPAAGTSGLILYVPA